MAYNNSHCEYINPSLVVVNSTPLMLFHSSPHHLHLTINTTLSLIDTKIDLDGMWWLFALYVLPHFTAG